MSVQSFAEGDVFEPPTEQEFARDRIGWIENYVPTEAVVSFVFLMAFFADASTEVHWFIVVGLAGSIPWLVLLDYMDDDELSVSRSEVAGMALRMVVGVIAFGAWSLLDPHNPISVDPRLAAVIAFVVTGAIPTSTVAVTVIREGSGDGEGGGSGTSGPTPP